MWYQTVYATLHEQRRCSAVSSPSSHRQHFTSPPQQFRSQSEVSVGIRSKTALQTKILHFLGPISTISQRACCWNRSRYTGSSWQHWLKNQIHYLPTIPNHLCHRTKWHYRGARSTRAITVIIRQSLGLSTNSKPP